jgi:hypothetical protein
MSEQKWRTTFGNMLGSLEPDEKEKTVDMLIEGLESMITKNGIITLTYEDKELSINASPSQDELMFLLFSRRRR